ncbi:hypothetical protein ACWGLJ_35745, partial [Streptomyces sp. NPDC055898]
MPVLRAGTGTDLLLRRTQGVRQRPGGPGGAGTAPPPARPRHPPPHRRVELMPAHLRVELM